MIGQLIIPRPITRLALAVVGVGLAQLLWVFLPAKLLAYASGVAAPYCLLIAGAVWSMRDKADSAFDGEMLTSAAYKQARNAASAMRRRSMARATYTAVAALMAGSAAISAQVAGPIWHWMVIGAGLAVAEASYSYLLAYQWEEQLRAIHERRRLSTIRQREIQSLKARVVASEVPLGAEHTTWKVGEVAETLVKPH
jgi:hypothetical protein